MLREDPPKLEGPMSYEYVVLYVDIASRQRTQVRRVLGAPPRRVRCIVPTIDSGVSLSAPAAVLVCARIEKYNWKQSQYHIQIQQLS